MIVCNSTYKHTIHFSLKKVRNDNLEQQAQALFKSWFVDFEPFKDGNFVDSELGMIPEGWNVATLRDIVVIEKDSINPQKNLSKTFVHYSLPAFDNGLTPEIQLGTDIKSNKFILNDYTTLFSKLNPRIKRIWFTHKVDLNSVCSTEFIPYQAKDPGKYSFVYSVISSDGFYNSIMSLVNGATGSHQRFHLEDSLNLKLAINVDVITELCKIVNPILDKIHYLRQENKELSFLRDSLLPKLMSGEIKINDLNC
ncbi:restriction endonuclease S subunit [Macellibacteroides fermentans]|uniref:Restriction endonuclease S subunit n=1 Tax=Macellibacteroides fermentans TaxID=879969 RepID=A0A8E2A4L0_9PORP|nr:restriction endonuclease S subunit [Macellibacteroides fermentans]